MRITSGGGGQGREELLGGKIQWHYPLLELNLTPSHQWSRVTKICHANPPATPPKKRPRSREQAASSSPPTDSLGYPAPTYPPTCYRIIMPI